MEGAVMVFQSEVTEQDNGLYTCQASFYHHRSTVSILVEVMSEEKLLCEFLHAAFSFYIQRSRVFT